MSDRPEEPKKGAEPKRPLIQIEGLSKLFPVRPSPFEKVRFLHAVDGVSLYVRKGETLGLVGESGCGKSTLGRIMLRLSEPTFGRIVFDGTEITHLPEADLRPLRRRMQIVFQDPYSSLNPRMTLGEIISEGIHIFKLTKNAGETRDRVAEMMKRVGLRPDMMGRYPHELSGGQRQRVGIARALAVEPDLIVCDEPVSALDVSVQAQIVNLLSELQETLSVGLLFISHDLRVVQWMSHRVAVMYLGRIVEMGPMGDVEKRRYHPYTRALMQAIVGEDGKLRPGAVLAGEPPSAVDPPSGCAFHPRCERAEKGRCDVEIPTLSELEGGSHHRVACFHPVTD